MALIALLLAASLTADPPRLVLGRDAGAQLTLTGVPAGATVTFSTSAGTVSESKRDGGTVRARFNAPALKSPTVALIAARIADGASRELAWAAIPLSGSDTMEIETRPGSKVDADVAGHKIGPVTADSRGTARLPMIVPPGVSTATLHIVDKLGNSSEKPLDLEPPPFTRVRVAARQDGTSSAAPIELEIFVVKPDGTPDDDARVELKSDDGDAEVRRRIGPGVYLGRFVAPARLTGSAHIEAKANGQLAAVDVPVGAAKVAIAQPFWRSALAVQSPWSVSVGPLGGGGATFDGAGTGTILLDISVRLEILPVEAVLDLGYSGFSQVSQFSSLTTNNAEKASAKSYLGEIGARLGRQLSKGLDAHLTLLFGLQDQVVDRTFATAPTAYHDHSWTPRIALAAGVNFRLGPGRLLGQVQFDSSASQTAGLVASLSSVQAMAGYLVTVY